MPNITARTVTRYYYQGRGYATEIGAYKAAAKQELNRQVLEDTIGAYGKHFTGDQFRAMFAAWFPVGMCGQHPWAGVYPGFQSRTACGCENRAYCNGSRWKWIKCKAHEMRSMAQAGNVDLRSEGPAELETHESDTPQGNPQGSSEGKQ